MKQVIYIALLGISCFFVACSGSKKTTSKKNAFTKTASGMEYNLARDVKSGANAKEGDFVEIHIKTYYVDSLIFDSRANNFNKPVTFPLSNPKFHGDLAEAIMLMSAGDSIVARVAVDSIIAGKQKTQPWMKPGGVINYHISLLSIKTQEQVNKEADAANSNRLAADDQTLKEYFAKNNITAKKTSTGLYYVITKPGTGDNAKAGQTVYVNYTGRTLDGNVFDSSVDPKFKHAEPFAFLLGRNNVIRGWDECIALLNKGSKATLYIPSSLAYGTNSPNPAIPPNSILLFDVELVDAK